MDWFIKSFLFAILIVAVVIVIILVWPRVLAKIDVDTGTFPTYQDSKGFYHIRGWIKNITPNETQSDISIEMTFPGGHFYKFALGYPTDTSKIILLPHQTLAWDHTTKAPFAYRVYYTMVARYNEVPFPLGDIPKQAYKDPMIPNSFYAGNTDINGKPL